MIAIATERAGVIYPELEDGMPVDHTICPACLGLEGQSHTCRICHGQAVCPTCRGAHLVRVVSGGLAYRVCPDCATDTGVRTDTGVPHWTLNPTGQQSAIRRYRLARWQERDTAMSAADEVDDYDDEEGVPF